MDHKKSKSFYGTPLNKSLQSDEDTDKRREKQGNAPARFHGAFTGGFSAGYFNTVDSVGGFKPKNFVSRRSDKEKHVQRFSHKPEDYMDEEDLGEFGIAPQRIRLNNQYKTSSPLGNVLKSSKQTIGEKILQQLNNEYYDKRFSSNDHFKALIYPVKNNFHGLGYKPLASTSAPSSSANPLTAVLNRGKKLKITGEAFGTGVIDDDDDYLLNPVEAYGYDDMSSYNFDRNTTKLPRLQPKLGSHSNLDGFVLAREESCLEIENLLKNFPLPDIPSDWKQPMLQARATLPLLEPELILKPSTSSDILKKKFTSTADILKSHDIGTKVGLVSYSDLTKVVQQKVAKTSAKDWPEEDEEPTISREVFEWRPCSLLCKHFNVPNPFPDNSFYGLKESKPETEFSDTKIQEEPKTIKKLASMELKSSVYDVTIQDVIQGGQPPVAIEALEDVEDDEELPQVVEIVESDQAKIDTKMDQSDSDDQDVEVVPVPKQKPELIILSSDSEDADSYGPPLPPTLRTLSNTNKWQTQPR